jgi:hypothetical protein
MQPGNQSTTQHDMAVSESRTHDTATDKDTTKVAVQQRAAVQLLSRHDSSISRVNEYTTGYICILHINKR